MIKTLIKKFIPKFILNYRRKKIIEYYDNKKIQIWNKEIAKEKEAEAVGKVEEYLSNLYKEKTGFDLHLNNPVTYTEKQQWLKLHGVTPQKTLCTDKLAVRGYIAERIGDEYLIPIIEIDGVSKFENAFDIDFDKLPDQFVIQCNHGSKMTHVIRNKKKYGIRKFKKLQELINKELQIDYTYTCGFEYVYKGIKPYVFITKYLEYNGDLQDYKFVCIDGNVEYCWVDKDREGIHKRATLTKDFAQADFRMGSFPECIVTKPKNYEKMLELVEKLSDGFDLVRVDLYNIDGRIYFGELTFSSASGMTLPYPIQWNEVLGSRLKLGD